MLREFIYVGQEINGYGATDALLLMGEDAHSKRIEPDFHAQQVLQYFL